MRNLVFVITCIVTTFAYAQTPMSDAEATALKAKVKALAATTKSITSDFTQYKHLDFLSNDIKTSGTLAFKTPDLVKWQYIDPFKYSVVFKEDKLFINDQGNKSKVDLGSNKLFKQLNTLIINSIKGDMFNDKDFEITYFKLKDNSQVHFKSRDPKFSEFIELFKITFNDKGDVVEVKLIEPSQDYTKIIFSNRVLNPGLSDAVFSN